MRHLRHASLLAIAILSSWAASRLVTAAQSSQTHEPPVFRSGVSLVAVPVFVTDKSGKAVAGLKAEDFEVEDNGKRVPIATFQAVDVDVAGTLEFQRQLEDAPVAVQAMVRRQFFILWDLQFSPTAGIYFGRKYATTFVRKGLAPSDLVALGVSGSGGLKILSRFTSDHEQVARLIEGVHVDHGSSADVLGLGGGDPMAMDSDSGGRAGLPSMDALANLAQQWDAIQTNRPAQGFMADLNKLVQILAPIAGRKQILLLSGGFPEREMRDLLLPTLFRKAGEADVVIQSVSLDGIRAPEQPDLSEPTAAFRPPDYYKTRGPGGDADKAIGGHLGRGTLAALSNNTGGRLIMPTNDFGIALREAEQISRHSYIIGFETDEATPARGKPHDLKIRVRREGLSVSHRPSYERPSPVKPLDESGRRLQATEALGKGISGGPLGLGLVALPYRSPDGGSVVHTVLQIEGPALAAAARGEMMSIQVYGYAFRSGRVLDSFALDTSVDLKKLGNSVRSSGARVVTSFRVNPGTVDLRFFVRAGNSDTTGSIQKNVSVAGFPERGPAPSIPVFAIAPAGQVLIDFQPRNRPPIDIPFRLGGESFIPDASVVLTTGRAREACVFVWRAGKDTAPALEVTGVIERTGEEPYPVSFAGAPTVLTDIDGFDRYVVKVIPPRVAPGPYRLSLTFRDPSTGLTSRSETGIVLEEEPRRLATARGTR